MSILQIQWLLLRKYAPGEEFIFFKVEIGFGELLFQFGHASVEALSWGPHVGLIVAAAVFVGVAWPDAVFPWHCLPPRRIQNPCFLLHRQN